MTACTTFDNGAQILTRSMPGRRTASLGVWLRSGVRDERPDESGYAHLLEHLLFRGGGTSEFAMLGGHLNAFTTRELTVLHGLVSSPVRLAGLGALFVDRLVRPLSEDDLCSERPAILQEIADAENDFPTSLEDQVLRVVWQGHSMSRSILGDPLAIQKCTAQRLSAYRDRVIGGEGLRIVAVGAVDHQALVESCLPLSRLPARASSRCVTPPEFAPRELRQHLPGQRSVIGWLMPVPTIGHPAAPALLLAERIAAAALIHELRERLGLVYDINSRIDLYSDCGLWWLQITCAALDADVCRETVETLIERLIARVPKREALLHAFHHLRARWLIEDDDIERNMERIALESLHLGRVRSLDERLSMLGAVSALQLQVALGHCWRLRSAFNCGPEPLRLKRDRPAYASHVR